MGGRGVGRRWRVFLAGSVAVGCRRVVAAAGCGGGGGGGSSWLP